ncbi:aminodeoxychorismate lyase [Pseudomonas huanghezhanensis]|uniref:aminodeoxychorismate lyase n=1 Tax=Pseudomonas huanghezhanensis TaxID=3002903 RepID=UPI0022861ACE|nr:aminodeoxychorismate lyase [Pseudomonas sp. BSw22131]
MTLCWVDGRPTEVLGVKDRGLAYGDGLFETVLVKSGQPTLLDRHLQRLASGGSRLAINLDLKLLRDECNAFAAQMGEGVLKLIVTRGDGQRGYAPAPDATPRRILQSSALPVYPAAHAEQGIRLFPCQTRLAEQPLLAGLKHLNRLEQVIARGEWRDALHAEGLMRDTSGRIVEGVHSNLFLVAQDVLFTADLSRCGVAGVMRAELLDQARSTGITVQIADLQMTHLAQADEVFVCNSVYGIWPVTGFERQHWSVGPLTRKLQNLACRLLDI